MKETKGNLFQEYKIFTVALAIKRGRGNGMRYKHENLNQFYKNLDLRISYNTLKKYWKELDLAGCITQQGEHLQLINWKDCAKKLGLVQIKDKYLNQFLREKNIKRMSLTEAVDWIQEILCLYHFRAQYHYLKSKIRLKNAALHLLNGKRNSNLASNRDLKKLTKEANNKGISTREYANRILRNEEDCIKTGSYHLSKLLNVSQKKANNLLNKMEKDRLIKRQVIKILHKLPICDSSYEFLKEGSPNSNFHPSKKGGYIEVIGSNIYLPIKKGKLTLFSKDRETNNKITMYKSILKTKVYA